jgi:hypothetical protein
MTMSRRFPARFGAQRLAVFPAEPHRLLKRGVISIHAEKRVHPGCARAAVPELAGQLRFELRYLVLKRLNPTLQGRITHRNSGGQDYTGRFFKFRALFACLAPNLW